MRTKTLLAASFVVLAACSRPQEPSGGDVDLTAVLGARDTTGFERVTAVPELAFPRDHGPHEGFRTEWWYWTGNVASGDGRAFGFELVFFRQALLPPQNDDDPAARASLASRELVLAHAAVTDGKAQRFLAEEKLLRRDGLRAGMQLDGNGPVVWCADWRAEPDAKATSPDRFPPMRLVASGEGFAFDLVVEATKPLVLQGDRGLSQKSAGPGNASIYYSATRLSAKGVVAVDRERVDVTGTAWCDREWSTSALGEQQVGWDWFSLQFEDGCELTWYQLRQRDGAIDPHSQGTFTRADGTSERLAVTDVVVEPVGTWTARDGKAAYPAAWRLRSTKLGLDAEVVPRVADQELRTRVRYWEGAVEVKGARRGLGYLEMTGYAK